MAVSNFDNVRLAMRRRLFDAGIATGNNDFHGENMPPLNIARQPFWVNEFVSGGVTRRWSTMRKRQYTVLLRYDFHVPLNTGTRMLSEKQAMLESAFDIMDDSKCHISADGWEIEVYRIQSEGDETDKASQIRPMTMYLRCTSKE